MKAARALLIFSFVLFGPLASANPCFEILKDVPQLRKLVEEVAADPDIPANVRSLLQKSLSSGDIAVIPLTQELRKLYNVPDHYLGIAPLLALPVYFEDVTPPKTANEKMQEEVRIPYDPQSRVYVSEVRENLEGKALMSLIHELAHLKLDAFVVKHFKQICDRLPYPYVRYFEDGTCHFHHQFWDFLHEKFAHEMHVRFLGAAFSKYFPPTQLPSDIHLLSDEPKIQTENIGVSLVEKYGYSIPEVIALAPLSVSEILTGGKGIWEVARGANFCRITEKKIGERCNNLMLAVSRILIAQLEGENSPRMDQGFASAEGLGLYLDAVLKRANGKIKVRALLEQAAVYVVENRDHRARLVRLANGPLREMFLKAGWQFSADEVAWPEILRGPKN